MRPYLPGYRGSFRSGFHMPPPYDLRLLFPMLFLVGIGIVMVYSASSAVALKDYGSDQFFLRRQALFVFLGLSVLLICRYFPIRFLRALAYPILGAAFVSLFLVLLPGFGIKAGGATRWLRLGPISFQPAEFARFAMVVYLAYSMSKKDYKLETFSVGFVPHVMILLVFTLLIMLQPDFGTVVILFAITWIMMFVGGVRLKYLLLSFLGSLPVVYLFLIGSSYRMRRIISFINPWQYAQDEGYQTVHSLMAFGTGGIWGVGLGKGYQKLFYLPEPHTDFIFSVIGEELGLIGVLLVVVCYAYILWNGIKIARSAEETFSSFLAVGLTVCVGLQACVNMGVALALLPTKGLTLPFISYGGTSLVMNMAFIGLLMNIGASQTRQGPS